LNKPIIQIFTDGSCHTKCNIGGWAAILLFPEEKKLLKGTVLNTTHNRMELLAVIKAIECANERFTDALLQIHTDSQYVCLIPFRKEKLKKKQFLTKKGTSIQNADLVQEIIQKIESHSIDFIKVKAHQKPLEVGINYHASKVIDYNREVDKLAREIVRECVKQNHTRPY
jgi:ribonuclease HI